MLVPGGDNAEDRAHADRDLRRAAGVVDDVADPHHVGGDGDAGPQHRGFDDIGAARG